MLIISAFTFIYIFIPNTKVKLIPAVIGALVAGILWESAGRLFATVVISSTNYVAIYSAFAALIFFLIWLYVGWIILLIGANIAFYVQNPDYVTSPRRQLNLSNHMKERIALAIILNIARHFYEGKQVLTAKQLAKQLNIPSEVIEQVLVALEKQSLVSQTNKKIPGYLPCKPLDEMSVADVLQAVRHANEDQHLSPALLPTDEVVEDVFSQMNACLDSTFADQSIKALVKKSVE